jgi:hypothetical protein
VRYKFLTAIGHSPAGISADIPAGFGGIGKLLDRLWLGAFGS